MNKEQTIQAVYDADISNYDWWESIECDIESMYARGYLSAKTKELGNSISSTDREYQESILQYLDYDIWK